MHSRQGQILAMLALVLNEKQQHHHHTQKYKMKSKAGEDAQQARTDLGNVSSSPCILIFTVQTAHT